MKENKLKRPSQYQVGQLRIALGMTGVAAVDDRTSELILVVISEVQRLGGKYSLRDAAKVAAQVQKWHTKP